MRTEVSVSWVMLDINFFICHNRIVGRLAIRRMTYEVQAMAAKPKVLDGNLQISEIAEARFQQQI